ncbi:MAG: extracellular solute-binding protein [Treponema sp.]|jgi:putative aldouronate transport system substrate-binding protein|nr:extracellular solute-binding protein [Treponema sp.]
MKAKRISILSLVVPALFAVASCSRQSGPAAATPVQSGPTPITIAISLHAQETAPDWSSPLGKFVLENTNVTVTGEYWPDGTVTEKQNLALASGELPDLFFATRDQAFLYGAEGIFEPLDDLLAGNAPHIMRYITPENSSVLKSPNDGKIYLIPKYYQLNTFTEWTFDYRRDILEEMGEPEPGTIEEWYQLFKKVQARYPDMVVLCERNRGVDMFTHAAFDMGKIDGYYGIIGSDFDKHRIVYLPVTNEWKDMLQFYNRFYAENILDHEYLTIQYNDWWERKIGGGRAFACWTMNMSRADQANQLAHGAGLDQVEWRVAETVKNYKTGERIQYKTANPWQEAGLALNAKSKVKEAAIKYIDFFFTDEFPAYGNYYSADTRFSNLGFTDRRTMAEWDWGKYIGYSGFFNYPQFFPYNVFENNNPPLPASLEHFSKNNKYVKAIPTITRSGDLERWVSATTDMKTYVDTAMDEFITGRRSFSQWDAYVQAVRNMGLDQAVETVQGWYDNYWNTVGK